jgi:hypothetical protein
MHRLGRAVGLFLFDTLFNALKTKRKTAISGKARQHKRYFVAREQAIEVIACPVGRTEDGISDALFPCVGAQHKTSAQVRRFATQRKGLDVCCFVAGSRYEYGTVFLIRSSLYEGTITRKQNGFAWLCSPKTISQRFATNGNVMLDRLTKVICPRADTL